MGKWFVGAEPKTVITGLRWTVAGLAGGLVLYVLVVGSYGLVIAALGALFPVIMAIILGRRRAKATRGPSPGKQSEVNTRYLRMTLDHDSGEMTGVVRRGSFEGVRLDDLGLSDLLLLWQECRSEDPQSAAVLEAYLDRQHAETWRDAAEERFGGAGARRPADGGAMSQEEALEILGLEKDPGEADIIEAHRRLMQKVHPDHGGSNYLASKINEAKDLLLKRSRS